MLAALMLVAQVGLSPSPPDLNWLAGYWLSCRGGREVAETWSDDRGGVLFGTTVSLGGDRVSSERTVMTMVEGRLAFVYEPTGANVVFPLRVMEGQSAVFENPDNDFPQRVIYSRRADVLTGRIEGTIDGQPQSMEWTYQAAEMNARCPES